MLYLKNTENVNAIVLFLAWKPEPIASHWISNGDKWYTLKQASKVITKLKLIRAEYHSEYTFGIGQTWVRDDQYQPLEHGNVIKSTERTVPLPEENKKKQLVQGHWLPVPQLPPCDWTDQQDYWRKLKEGVL